MKYKTLFITGTSRGIKKDLLEEIIQKPIRSINESGLKNHEFIEINGEYLFTHMFSNKVYKSKYFKKVDKVIFLGMAYGFKCLEPNDYSLPTRFARVKKKITGYKMALFKEREAEEETIIIRTTKEIEIKNILEKKEYQELIKQHLNQFNTRLNPKGEKVITTANSRILFTPYNTLMLQEQGFNMGEMETYHLMKIIKKLKVPVGCILVCTDNIEQDIRDYVAHDWRNLKQYLEKTKEVEEKDRRKYLKLIGKEKTRPYDKFKSKMKKKYNKQYYDAKARENGDVFEDKPIELYYLMKRIIDAGL